MDTDRGFAQNFQSLSFSSHSSPYDAVPALTSNLSPLNANASSELSSGSKLNAPPLSSLSSLSGVSNVSNVPNVPNVPNVQNVSGVPSSAAGHNGNGNNGNNNNSLSLQKLNQMAPEMIALIRSGKIYNIVNKRPDTAENVRTFLWKLFEHACNFNVADFPAPHDATTRAMKVKKEVEAINAQIEEEMRKAERNLRIIQSLYNESSVLANRIYMSGRDMGEGVGADNVTNKKNKEPEYERDDESDYEETNDEG